MAETVLLLVAGLEIKHFIADYLLQTSWMISGKADFRQLGGYAHAGVHVIGSLIVLVLAGTPLATVAWLIAAEFVIHYALDYSKVRYSVGITASGTPSRFWALHGFDQVLHQMTYAAMIYFALRAMAVA